MSYLPFTTGQMKQLEGNQFTRRVTSDSISFTYDFKVFILAGAKEGKSSVEIFTDAGYDVKVLGKTRVYNYVKRVKREAAANNGRLKEPRESASAKRFADKELSRKKSEAAIKELQDRIVYLEQEIEFLKKTSRLRLQYQESQDQKR